MGFFSSTQHPGRFRDPPTHPAKGIEYKEPQHEVPRSVELMSTPCYRPIPPQFYLGQNVTKQRAILTFKMSIKRVLLSLLYLVYNISSFAANEKNNSVGS